MSGIRVVVADDQEVVRAGLSRILDLEDGVEVVGQCANGDEAVRVSRRLVPDVVLMDIRMPVVDGLSATRTIREEQPGTRVVVLTTFDLDEYVYGALRAGATGFVLKDSPADDIVRAVRAAAAGDALVSPSVTRKLIAEFARRGAPRAHPGLSLLTDRETDVLLAMARGQSNAEIARHLFISEGTTRTHITHLLAKLGVRDRVQAVVLAYEAGFVTPGQGDGHR
ncbi:response regulator transcription factor [Phycicoccus ginsengisoli]